MASPANFTYPVTTTVPTFNVFDSIILEYTTDYDPTEPIDLKTWSFHNGTRSVNTPNDYENVPVNGPYELTDLESHGNFDHYPIYIWLELDHNGTRFNPAVQFSLNSDASVPATTWAQNYVIVSGTTSSYSTTSTITSASSTTSTSSLASSITTSSSAAGYSTAPSSGMISSSGAPLPTSTTDPSSAPQSSTAASSGLSEGAIAGIAVGCVVAVLGLLGIIIFSIWRRRKQNRDDMGGRSELPSREGGYNTSYGAAVAKNTQVAEMEQSYQPPVKPSHDEPSFELPAERY